MNMHFYRKLPIPMEIKEQFPITAETERRRDECVAEMKRIFSGESDKFILVIGPCSADKEDSVLEYIYRLRGVQDKVADKLLIVPRIYTNKPRTTGMGYMGLLHQPDPTEKPDLLKGILAIRDIHIKTITQTGFTCADELLYPENYRYLSDVLSYVTIGARSVEDQQHRLVASGLDVPVGMKNPISGDLGIMLNSVEAAQSGHTFLYRGWEVMSEGNEYAHSILRGSVDYRGRNYPNYYCDELEILSELYHKRGLKHPAVIVDTNHSNSNKNPLSQPYVVEDVLDSRKRKEEVGRLVKGFMVESYLVDGCQEVGGDVYGQSITDPCLGWERTKKLIYKIADEM